jgi:drug/metabolite transporter (DMT)-like permease
MMKRNTLIAAGLFSLSTLFWAGNIIAGRIAGADIGPVALSLLRWSIAFVVILPFAWNRVRAQRDLYLRHWPLVLMLTLLNVASYNTLIYWGLNHTTAINAAVLNSAFPVAVFALTWITGEERCDRWQFGGMLLAVIGVFWVAIRGDLALLAVLSLNPGTSPFWRHCSASPCIPWCCGGCR